MEWSEWQPIYLDIVQRLDLDTAMDRKATELLTGILREIDPQPLLNKLRESMSGRSIVVCGAGPSLESHIQKLKARNDFPDLVMVAADGAVSVLLEQGIKCDAVTTDLDGDIKHLMEMKRRGAILIVHGHGDNIEIVKSVVPELGDILGSTQVEPTNRAFLWGGFTDGDRACHVVSDYNPERMILAGMDFGSLVGHWSKPEHDVHFVATLRKKIKLEIAKELISSLLDRTGIEHFFLNPTESG
jgi:hypothetical protein